MGDPARQTLDVPRIDKGLDDVYVKETSICFVDGQRGRLLYRGYDIRDLAERSTFEETAFLILHGHLPNRAELDQMTVDLAKARRLSPNLVSMIRRMPRSAAPADVLRTSVSLLGSLDSAAEEDRSKDTNLRKARRLVGGLASIVAAYHRLRQGLRPVPSDPKRPHAEDFLRMVHGKPPPDAHARFMDATMLIYADHSMNASTFAATVAASTLPDLYSTIVAAISTLKGPLHGGAIEAAFETVQSIAKPEAAEESVMRTLARRGKIFGFGHRVYKTYDPRAILLRDFAQTLSEEAGDARLFRIAERLQETVVRELEAKRVYPNVDFYSGLVFHFLGLPTDLSTSVFAIARSVGWIAHVLEYWEDNRILRPLDYYVGPKDLTYVPLSERR